MSTLRQNLTGKTFGWLRVITRSQPRFGRENYWLCRCRCGVEKIIRSDGLRSGDYVSCGCQKLLGPHNMSRTPEHRSWCSMIERCYTKSHKDYPAYGGRGIKVCARWRKSFLSFYADMGSRPPLHSLHRIDNDAGYSPTNCKWATAKEQASNRRPARRRA